MINRQLYATMAFSEDLMRMIRILLIVGFACFAPLTAGQEQQQEQEQEVPPPPPRVVGQAQTQEEFEAWTALNEALDPAQKAELAQAFLATYPDSGLSSFIHQILALHYDQTGDVNQFVSHAQKSLVEMPDNAPILARLAFISAEQGQSSQRVIDQAEHSLSLLAAAEKPAGVAADTWLGQREQLRADAYYALGRVYLNRFNAAALPAEERPDSPDLKQAIQYFSQTLEHDPRHDYAYFRLGFAETNANNAEQAMHAYAGAVVSGGVAAGPAQQKMQEIHAFMKENMKDSEMAKKSLQKILQDHQLDFQKTVEVREQNLLQRAEEIRQEELEAQQQQELEAQQAETEPAPPPSR
jgi:tetratricopeptide (TPR) repeat protein